MKAVAKAMDHKNRFTIGEDSFEALEIHSAKEGSKLYYFYDASKHQLVKDFILHDGPKVMTLCTVTLIYTQDGYSPRFKFWKADKTLPDETTEDDQSAENLIAANTKSSVDIDKGNQNLWKLIAFLQSCQEVTVPQTAFKVVTGDAATLVTALAETADKSAVLEAVSTIFAGVITQADLNLMANRRGQLDRFEKLLNSTDYFESEREAIGKTKDEDVWQAFFEANPWIFGYGLSLVSSETIGDLKLEQITTGAGLLSGAGKRVDAILQMRGAVGGLLFCEIKTHTTALLAAAPYRNDVYIPAKHLIGGVAQVKKTAEKFVREAQAFIREVIEKDGTRTGIEISTVRPRQVVVIGQSTEFEDNGLMNPEKTSSFELYRRSILDTEVITFDELYERAKFIIDG
jgi:hypothetical protein